MLDRAGQDRRQLRALGCLRAWSGMMRPSGLSQRRPGLQRSHRTRLVRRRGTVTWFDHHQHSKKLAAAAQSALRCGDEPGARRIYAQAAQEAEKALALVPRWKQ